MAIVRCMEATGASLCPVWRLLALIFTWWRLCVGLEGPTTAMDTLTNYNAARVSSIMVTLSTRSGVGDSVAGSTLAPGANRSLVDDQTRLLWACVDLVRIGTVLRTPVMVSSAVS